MIFSRRTSLVVFLLAFMPAASVAQRARSDWWIQHYNVQNGLPSSSIIDMAVDTMGFLWLATEGGLISFDGRNFRSTELIPGHAPLSNRMRDLVTTTDGGLLAADVKGTSYSVHGFDMAWIQHRTAGRVKVYGSAPDVETYAALVDTLRNPQDHSGAWAECTFIHGADGIEGIVRGDNLTRIQKGKVLGALVLPTRSHSVFQLSGHIYGFTDTLGCFGIGPQLDRTAPVRVQWPTGFNKAAAEWQLFWDPAADEAFLLMDQHLHTVRSSSTGDTLTIAQLELELPKNTRITCMAVPWKENVLAIGTLSKGLFLYQRMAMRTVECGTGTGEDQAYYAQLDMGEEGVLTVSSNLRAVLIGEDGCIDPAQPLRVAAPAGLARDAAGWIWSARAGATQAYDPATGQVVQLIDGAHAATVFLVEGDSMWLADRHRLGYVKDFQVHWLSNLNGSSEDRPAVIRRLPDGRLCYASCQGLFVARDASYRAFAPLEQLQGLCIRAVDVTGGRIFLGTYGQGVYLWKDDELRRIPMDRQGSLSHVHATVKDGRDVLWFSTNRGMLSTTLKELLVYMADTTQAPHFTYYGERAGLVEPEMNGGCSPAWIRCNDGRLSFPSMGGAVRFVPEDVPDQYPLHPISIGDVAVDGARWPIDEYSIYPAGTRRVVIPYAVAFWGDPENAQWEYRITGLQDMWLPLDAHRTELVLERPPVGEHEVYIRPVGAYARGMAPELFFWFRVEPAFLSTWLGRLVIAGVVLLIAFLVWRIRSARLRARNRALEEHVHERTAELARSLESSAMLNAIITHDIVTPLTFIARVARGARAFMPPGGATPALSETLDDLSSSAEKLHDKASDLLTWMKFNTNRIAASHDAVDLHAEVARIEEHWTILAEQEHITLRNDVPERTMVRSDRRVLGVIINNLVSNAVVHGGAGANIWIDHHRNDTEWILSVHDSGRGIAAETLRAIRALIARPVVGKSALLLRSDMQSLGFAIVVSLSRSLGGSVRVESGANGTHVSIAFPIEQPNKPGSMDLTQDARTL